MKRLTLFMAVGTVAPTLFASVVHTPREAWLTGTNLGTDSQGAVWTASRRTNANDPISAGILLDQPISTATSCGFEKWDGGDSQVYLYFGDTPHGQVNPGDIVMKPTSKGYGNCRVAVTFEAPRSGWYSMSARFRAIDTTSATGVLDTSIIVGSNVMLQQALTHTAGGTPAEGAVCSFTRKFITKGTKIEFVVGPRWDDWEDWWNAHLGDTTTLSLSLVEEESVADESQTLTADLGSMLSTLTAESAGTTGSFADASGIGIWSLYHIAQNTTPITDSARVPLSRVAASDIGQKTGVAFRSSTGSGDSPYVKAFVNTAASALGVTEQNWALPFDTVSPGEAILNPDGETCVGLRFVPNESGVYVVSLRVRDISMSWDSSGTWDDSGVDVSILVNGEQKSSVRVSAETQMPSGTYAWNFLQPEAFVLQGGAPIDIVVDPRSGDAYDKTGFSLQITKLPSSYVAWNGAFALRDAIQTASPVNPFVSQGATWTAGSATVPGKSGDFSALATWYDWTTHFHGWRQGSDAMPIVAGSTLNAKVRCDEEGISGKDGAGNDDWYISPDEFVVHPGQNCYGINRFTVPADGVYRVTARCRDLGVAYGTIPSGVTGAVYANDKCVAEGKASCDDWLDPALQANLAIDRLYLRAGDVIDMGVVVAKRSLWNDQTAVRESIAVDKEIPEVVSVDISPNHATVYAGQGRVGFASAEPVTWAAVCPVAGGTQTVSTYALKKPNGDLTGSTFTLTPPTGGSFAVEGSGEGLVADGVAAADSSVQYGWTLTGLVPNAVYSLILFGTGDATFAVGGKSSGLTGAWFDVTVKDHAVLEAKADADGTITGTFAGGAAAGTFCGLQAEGPGYAKFRKGCVIIVR